MEISSYAADILIYEFSENYLKQLFYFCLKKTSSEDEANELVSDISLNIIASLRGGTLPENFSAYIWKIARNRYAEWAKKKHKAHESFSGDDITELNIVSDELSPDESLIKKEDIKGLRRELSFISLEYRNILLAYYVENKSIGEISSLLHLPCGTVKSKLFRARNILKEGMNMAREFGKRSYNPESLGFISSGYHPSELPFSAIQRKIPVNILCQANNNPSTIEELSMELGIAAPYMEEEVSLLVKAELLKKLDGEKYLTSFFISPKECQTETNEICCDYAERNYEAIWNLAGIALKKAKELGVLNGTISDIDAQMFFAFNIEQKLILNSLPNKIFCKFNRADGGNWGFIGNEKGAKYRLPQEFFNNSGNYSNDNLQVIGYQSNKNYGKMIYKNNVPDSFYNLTLKNLVKSNGDISDLSESEKANVEILLDEGFIKKTGVDKYLPAMLIFCGDAKQQINEYIVAQPEFQRIEDEVKTLINDAKKIVAKYCTPHLKDDFDYYVAMSLNTRSIFSMLWKDKALYTGGNAQFIALYI